MAASASSETGEGVAPSGCVASSPPSGEAAGIDADRVLQLLSRGTMTVVGQIVVSSNYAFLTRIEDAGASALAVYKPRRGEIPLWDFPSGSLCLREVAAFLLSRALGWPSIPPTVLRDGAYGPGMVQLYIACDLQDHYFTFGDERRIELVPIALFDLLTNNADRKGGHLLLGSDGIVWAIDHALTFHPEPKLRTVVWDFAGQPIPQPYLDDLAELLTHLAPGAAFRLVLAKLLAEEELVALTGRAELLVARGHFPQPDPERRQIPWPPV